MSCTRPFQFRYRRFTITMPTYLTIEEDRKMKWSDKKSDVGSRRFRHRAGRLVKLHSRKLPITVVVRRIPKDQPYHLTFRPMLVNGTGRNVIFYYKNVMVIMRFEDTVFWIRTFITTNKMYDQPRFQVAV